MPCYDSPLTVTSDLRNLVGRTWERRSKPSKCIHPSVVYVVTSSLATVLLTGQLAFIRGAGFDVTVVSSPGELLEHAGETEMVRCIAVPMSREISPFSDFIALWRLWRLFRQVRPAIINISTPKAGLLGGLAGWLAGVPCRVYTMRGLRLETAKGLKRVLLSAAERLTCRLAHRVVCVSSSLRQKAVNWTLVSPEHSIVLCSGSSNGVALSRFAVNRACMQKAIEIRAQLGIPPRAEVVGFVGRLTRDKGVVELVQAVARLRAKLPAIRLLLLGDFEPGDPLPNATVQAINHDPFVIAPGFVTDLTSYYHVMTVVALPTYREGFPNVLLEAQAAGKPVVTTRATGTTEAIVDGVTGLTVPVGDVPALSAALEKILDNPVMAAEMGRCGQQHVAGNFRPEAVWKALVELYGKLLAEHGLLLPSPNQTFECSRRQDCDG